MFELIRKSLLASLGAAVVTKEKVENATKRWVDDGKISREEAEKLAHDLVDSGRKQWEELQAKVTGTVRKTIEGLDLVPRKEFDEIKEKLKDIEKRLDAIQDAAGADRKNTN